MKAAVKRLNGRSTAVYENKILANLAMISRQSSVASRQLKGECKMLRFYVGDVGDDINGFYVGNVVSGKAAISG